MEDTATITKVLEDVGDEEVTVRMKDGSEYHGHVHQVDANSFEVDTGDDQRIVAVYDIDTVLGDELTGADPVE